MLCWIGRDKKIELWLIVEQFIAYCKVTFSYFFLKKGGNTKD